ncbi:MAG: hypothetical protein H0X67_00925 [Acidobacteria bacterium]|nr:hypothetical protein [Acidobacteriota bacterium]
MPEPGSRLEVRRRTILTALSLFLTTASFTLARTGRDALYFRADGIFDLPFAYMGMAVLSLPMAAVTLGLMERLGVRRARLVLPLLFGSILLGFAPAAHPGGGPTMTAFFLLVPLAYGVLFSLVWLLGADLLADADGASRATAYGRLGAASLGGNLAGAATSRLLAAYAEANALIALAGLLLFLAVAVLRSAHDRCPPRRLAPVATPVQPETLAELSAQPYFRRLLAAGIFAAFTGILVEFQFYLAAASAGHTPSESIAFFANLYLAVSVLALVVQLGFLARLQRRIGLGRTLVVLPATLALLTPAAIISASLVLRSVLRLAEGGLKSSIHRVSWEQAYLGLPPRQRGAARLLVDGAASRMAEGAVAVVLYVALRGAADGTQVTPRDVWWVTYLLVAAAVGWVLVTRPLMRWQAAGVWPREDSPDLRMPDS